MEQSPVYVTEKTEITLKENIALQEAIKKVEKSVVGIRTKTKAGKILEGSGLVMTSDGLVVTLAELVPAGSDFSFFVEGESQGYEILDRDLEHNLALIKLNHTNLKALSFADLDRKQLGERVFLVGTIFNQKGEPQGIVNEGIIKYFSQDSIHTNIFEKYTLTGSPLFDIEGNVLGLNEIDREGKIITILISLIRDFTKL